MNLILKNCEVCNKEFETNTLKSKYCSENCSRKAIRERARNNKEHNAVCEECGRTYYKRNEKSTTCSEECTKKNSLKKLEGLERKVGERSFICEYCGGTFYSTYKKNTCSFNCSNMIKIKQSIGKRKIYKEIGPNGEPYKNTCVNCGKEFWSTRRANKTCSKECLHERTHGKEKVENTKKTINDKYSDRDAYRKIIKEKQIETNRKKYGVDYYNQLEDVREKSRKCMKENQDKLKQGMKEKYGVENAMDKEEFREKAKTNLIKSIEENHNGVWPTQSHIKNFDKWNDNEFIKENFVKDNEFQTIEFCKFFNVPYGRSMSKKYELGLKEMNNDRGKTKTQNEIFHWIKSFYNGEIIFNDRNTIKPLELDISIPEAKIAIEYSGLMFHSYGKSNHEMFNNHEEESLTKFHMLEKTNLCEEQGFKLYHIWENEWNDIGKREIWKSMIKVALNCADNKINARDCEIKEVSSSEAKDFLLRNHMQGHIHSPVRLGLYYNNKLIQLITLGKSRFNKKYDWELHRQCTELNTIVRGGFSKLLKYFKENYEGSIISYGNRRWTSKINSVYGDNLIDVAKPNYFYFNDFYAPILYSRVMFQKHKLKDKLEIFDESLTEVENMYNNNYRRVWDCGNLVYEL